MDQYIINKHSGRPTKIGSRAHKKHILSKIRENTKNSIILTNIDVSDSKKIKKSLPKLNGEQFYHYDHVNKNVITKNKSLKTNELLSYISKKLPDIIDKIIDDINEDDDRDATKQKMLAIFYDSLL